MSKIPSRFYKFFRWFCKPELFEELQGDLEEAFEENVTLFGQAKAESIYRKEVIKMLRPSVFQYFKIFPRFNHTIMFRNYLKTSIRTMKRNPLTSFINIFGLSVAIGICLVVYSVMDLDFSIDAFHENKNEVYLATYFVNRDGTELQYGNSPMPLGNMLKEDFAHINKMCRVRDQNAVIKHGDNVFQESVRLVDPTFLEMLTFPLKWGTAGSLNDMNSVILSEENSLKYFGDENPIGENILVKFGENRSKNFIVSGVAQAFPTAHAIEFGFLINFENIRFSDPQVEIYDWRGFVNATLIQIDNPQDLYDIEAGMEKYKSLQNEVERDWAISSFKLEQLAGLHFKSRDIIGDISHDNYYEGRMVLPIIALFMLILACFNYVNIAIVSATKRLKEIGLRKVIGANKSLVVVQFLTENIFTTFFALVLGILLTISILLPSFIDLSGMELTLSFFDAKLWIFFISTLLFTGVVSGIYPAFYISKFETVKIFKGSVKFGQKNRLTKVFLGIQLIFACIGITGSVMFTQNSNYQGAKSWGYEQKRALYAQVSDRSSYDQLNAAMGTNPDILTTSGSQHHLGRDVISTVVRTPDREYEVRQLSVDASYFETMGLKLEEGRVFQQDFESDKQTIVVNQLLVENLKLSQPIGQTLKIGEVYYEIIGVMRDFYIYSFYSKMRPTIFKVAEEEDYRFLSMKIREGAEAKTYEALQTRWSALFPETPFQGGYQEDVWGSFYEELGVMKKFMGSIAFIAVLLASLGLYGLVTLNVSGRTREFSIRKALGAQLQNLTGIIVKQYTVLVLIAITIGAPISYLMIKANLDMMFPHPMPHSYSGVAIAVVILVIVLLLVISTQIRKIAKANPVDGLKVE
ncbi:MAG: ABC transporter permease [Cyclobacteriaceae bacterium]